MKSQLLLALVTSLGLVSMSLPSLADKPSSLAPDLIIVNALVHTMDPRQPFAQAVAIHGNRIVAVGTSKEIRKMVGSLTRVVDAQKRVVLPGFNDSHVHFLSGGFQLSSVDLRDASTPQEFAERIRLVVGPCRGARRGQGQRSQEDDGFPVDHDCLLNPEDGDGFYCMPHEGVQL